MVDALASDRSDQSFGEAVLPRRAWGDGLVTDAHGAQSVRDGSAIDAIPITDHVARRLSPRECFGDLACDPVRGRTGCDVDPDEVSAGQPNDDKGIEQVEANGRNNEQVHGGVRPRIIAACSRRHVVQVGRALSPSDVACASIHVYPAPFGREGREKPPFPSDPHYDAKAWEQCAARKNHGRVLFWNVAGPAEP